MIDTAAYTAAADEIHRRGGIKDSTAVVAPSIIGAMSGVLSGLVSRNATLGLSAAAGGLMLGNRYGRFIVDEKNGIEGSAARAFVPGTVGGLSAAGAAALLLKNKTARMITTPAALAAGALLTDRAFNHD